jgi:hypothetical protein
MIEDRFKRLIVLVLVVIPIVFGGLAINAHNNVSEFQVLLDQSRQKRIDQDIECKKLTGDGLRLGPCGKGLDIDPDKIIVDRLVYWRERLDFYEAIAMYIPLATIALYFSVKWVWFGKVSDSGKIFDRFTVPINNSEKNRSRFIELIVRHKKNTVFTLLFFLLLAISYYIAPETMYHVLVSGTVQVVVVVGVVWLVKIFFTKK